MSQMVWTFPGGKLVQTVTSITLVNATAKTQDTTVPAGKIWLLLSIKAVNRDDVTRDITINKFVEAAKTSKIKELTYASTATNAALQWPNLVSNSTRSPLPSPYEICKAGNTIEVVWASGGASTGATDADGLVIEYLEIDA